MIAPQQPVAAPMIAPQQPVAAPMLAGGNFQPRGAEARPARWVKDLLQPVPDPVFPVGNFKPAAAPRARVGNFAHRQASKTNM